MEGALKQIEPRYNNTDGKYYVSNPTAHAQTERWRYTVPAGKRAIITHIYVQAGICTAGKTVSITLEGYIKGGTVNVRVAALVSVSTIFQFYQSGEALYLDAGDYILLNTYSDDAAAVYMGGGCTLVEYDH